jgi:hypothetical protein
MILRLRAHQGDVRSRSKTVSATLIWTCCATCAEFTPISVRWPTRCSSPPANCRRDRMRRTISPRSPHRLRSPRRADVYWQWSLPGRSPSLNRTRRGRVVARSSQIFPGSLRPTPGYQHRHAVLVAAVVVPKQIHQIALFQQDADEDVSRRHGGKQQVSNRHRRR